MTIKTGGKWISFALMNVDGRNLALEDLARNAKGVTVIFSCNHCPYVLAWEDRMIELGRMYPARGIPFVLINANDPKKYPEDGFDGMVRRAREKGYPFPYLHDADQSTARSYGANRTPEAFLFDSEGRLRYHGRIDDNYDDPDAVRSHDLRDALEAVLAGRDPVPAETPPVGCTIKWK